MGSLISSHLGCCRIAKKNCEALGASTETPLAGFTAPLTGLSIRENCKRPLSVCSSKSLRPSDGPDAVFWTKAVDNIFENSLEKLA